MERCKTVDEYLAKHGEWEAELSKLRKILNATELEETVKWGAPCYTLGGKNVIGIGAFQEYCGLWFHQGVYLKDPEQVLINAGEGKTRGLRQWRFRSAREIKVALVKAYVKEAIANQEQGKEIGVQRDKVLVVPPELQAALKKKAKTRKAFEALTPGKQREYAEYIATAKQEKTKLSRLEKIVPMIESGVGLHDKYRNC